MSLINSTVPFTRTFFTFRRISQLRAHFVVSPRTMASSASVPKTMKGVSIAKTGGVEVLDYKTDMPVPSPKEGEVLVKNDFIGINYIDT